MTVSASRWAPDLTDAELVARVRGGDRSAYAALYERYAPMARRFARSRLANQSDAEDVVSEVFASVLGAFEKGRGPVESFVPYLIGSMRNECHRANRRRAREPTSAGPGDEAAPPSRGQPDPYAAVDEATLLREAFESLPPRFQDVLWRTEVDGLSCGEVGARFRLTRHAVAMLALRARRALASAYLAHHLAVEHLDAEVSPICRETRLELVGLVRGRAGLRQRRQLGRHLRACTACDEVRERLDRLNRHLHASPLLPAAGLGSWALGSVGMNGAIKAHIVAWWSATAPVAVSGLAVVSVLSPTATGSGAPWTEATPPARSSPTDEPHVVTQGVDRGGQGEPMAVAAAQHVPTATTHGQSTTGTPQTTPASSAVDSNVGPSSEALASSAVDAGVSVWPHGGDVAATDLVPVVDPGVTPGPTAEGPGRGTGPGAQAIPPSGGAAAGGRRPDDLPAPGPGNRPQTSPAVGNGHGAAGVPPGQSQEAATDQGTATPGPGGGGPPAHAGGPFSEPPGSSSHQPGPTRSPAPPAAGNPNPPAAASSGHTAPPGTLPASAPPSAAPSTDGSGSTDAAQPSLAPP